MIHRIQIPRFTFCQNWKVNKIILIFFLPFGLNAQTVMALAPHDFVNRASNQLEAGHGIPISPMERQTLHDEMKEIENLEIEEDPAPGGSNMLICGRAAFDIIVGGSIATCVDLQMNAYYLVTASTGFALGFHVAAFVLVYRSYDGSGVTGIYYGGKGTVAAGAYGGILGLFLKGSHSEGEYRNRLYWVGYAAGATLDLVGMVVYIQKI